MVPFKYIIADNRSKPLASAVLENSPDSPILQLQILDGDIQNLMKQKNVLLIGFNDGTPILMGRILDQKDTTLMLEPEAALGENARQNLRVSVRFNSFIYPVTGLWHGRFPIVSHDLSCSGLAFFCKHSLLFGEVDEIVIPITRYPLLVHAKIIGMRPSNFKTSLYAAEFVDLVSDMETMIRGAVFGLQILNKENDDFFLPNNPCEMNLPYYKK